MKVTYLGHSGFLVSTDTADYLFDYIRGELPKETGSRPLYVFASHFHEDHFSEKIFSLKAAFILGADIRTARTDLWKKLPENIQKNIIWAHPGQEQKLSDSVTVRLLDSTDSGVAFLVSDPEGMIYHAGDLNWWHWDGEPEQDNEDMKVRYCREIDKLKDQPVKAAFVVLDPRQEQAYALGMEYFLRNVSCPHVFPMHFWKDYTVADRFIGHYGYADRLHMPEREGQTFFI